MTIISMKKLEDFLGKNTVHNENDLTNQLKSIQRLKLKQVKKFYSINSSSQ